MQLMTDNSTKKLINLTKQIYNGLTQAIEDGDTKEAAERLRQDDVISAKVTEETDARIQADSDEATTRQQKDAELQKAIETETSNREAADKTLTDNITAEATVRANADIAINNKLDPVKTLIDTVFLGEIVKDHDKGMENNKYKPVFFGTVSHSHVGLGTAGDGNTKWHKEAVKVLYKRLKDKGYKGAVYLWGFFQPAMYQWVLGSMSISTDSTYGEDASGYPICCQFISLTYGGETMYRFGTNNATWYFETIPTTTRVNTLISNAQKALETAYKNADSALSNTLTTAYKNADAVLQTDITAAYQQADTDLSNTLTTAYTDADIALRTELEGKINNIGTAELTETNLLPLTSIKTQYDTNGAYIAFGKVTSVTPVTYNKHTLNADGTILTTTLNDTPQVGDFVTAYLTGSQKSHTDTWVTHAYIRDKYGYAKQWIFSPATGHKDIGRALPFVPTPVSFEAYSYPNTSQYNVTVSYNTYLKVRLTGNSL